MKRKLIQLWSVIVISLLLLSVGLHYLIITLHGKDFIFTDSRIVGFITYLLLWSVGVFGIYFFFPLTKYIDSNNSEKPSFKFIRSSEIDVPPGFDFSYLKSEISKKWFITFSDDREHVLKFMSKMNFFNWGVSAATWLKFDEVTQKIQLECFSLSGLPNNDYVNKMHREIEEYISLHKQH